MSRDQLLRTAHRLAAVQDPEYDRDLQSDQEGAVRVSRARVRVGEAVHCETARLQAARPTQA